MTALPPTASTVIIGGGIVGCASAYFLADRGETDVLLLERSQLGAGTTKGGLGGIRQQFSDELDVRLSLMALEFWRDFDSLTGGSHDFREGGYLFLAQTQGGLATLHEPMTLYKRLGVPAQMLDRAEISELVPGLRVDDLAGGRFCPTDGYGDPLAAVAGFAGSAVLQGVRVAEGVDVLSISRTGDRVTGVVTSRGTVSADRVLLAAGVWSGPLAATVGVVVPVFPYARSVVDLSSVPALSHAPLVVEVESGFHFRPRGPGLRLGLPNLAADGSAAKGPASPPTSFDRLDYPPLEFPAGLEAWAVKRATNRHPAFRQAQVTDRYSCYVDLTPDQHPIVGLVPGVSGLAIAAGFSGHGFMHAPAMAQLVVEEMLDGRAATLDIGALSLSRFASGIRSSLGQTLL